MDRINSVGTQLIGGIRQWVNKNLLGGIPGTQINATYMNDLQEELVHGIIEAAGLVPTAGVQNQLEIALGLMYAGALVGTARNAAMNVAAAGTTVAFTADELIVSKSLGGFSCKIGAFNEPLNLATTGAGGMDTGSAPHSSFVAIYAIYNPTTGAAGLLAQDATGVVAPEVYGGAYMPAGYAYSALVSVWPTDSSGRFAVGLQNGRRVSISQVNVVSSLPNAASLTAFSITNIPKNAISFSGSINLSGAAATACDVQLASTSSGVGLQVVGFNISSSIANLGYEFSNFPIIKGSQQAYYIAISLTSGPQNYIACSGYEF